MNKPRVSSLWSLLLAFICAFAPLREVCAQVRVISRTNDVRLLPTSQDTIYWFTGETVQYDIYARNGRSAVVISNSAVPMWYVTDSTLTNYFVMNTGTVVSATNGQVRFTLTPTYSALTSKLYQSAAIIYFQSPTNPTLQLVVDRTAADVRKSFSYAGTYRGPITSTNWTLDGNTPVFATFWTANATGIYSAIQSQISNGNGATNFVFYPATNTAGYLAFLSNAAGTAYFNIGTNGTGGSSIDTNAVIALINASTNTGARLASNVWAAADSTTNYVMRTGDTLSGPLSFTAVNSTRLAIGPTNGDAWFGAFGALDTVASGIQFAPHATLAQVPVMRMGAVFNGADASFLSGPLLSMSGIGELDGGLGAGDYMRLEYVGGDTVTQRLASITADAGGSSGASARFVISNGVFSGDGTYISNVTAVALNGNAAQSLLTNNLVIRGTAPVTVTTTTGGNITTATVALATGTLAFTNALLAQVSISDGAGGTNLVVVSNSAARLYFQRASNVAFFGFTGYPTNAAFAISVECAPSATSFAFDPAISNRIAVVFNATNATLFQARKNRSESWVSVKQQ